MNIEEEIFKKYTCDYNKLLEIGFTFNNNSYNYETTIMNGDFTIYISINNKGIFGKIIDSETNIEYTNYRLEEAGLFSGSVREEYIKVLNYIKDKCFNRKLFVFEQSNRVSNYIYDKYGKKAEFLFKDDFYTGVFRNDKKKWFGIIMYVSKDKFVNKIGKIEVINIKIDRNDLSDLLKIDGIYEAYHMNKKSWVSVFLDDTLSDKILFSLIDKSYELVK